MPKKLQVTDDNRGLRVKQNLDEYSINLSSGRVLTRTNTAAYKKLFESGLIKVLRPAEAKEVKPEPKPDGKPEVKEDKTDTKALTPEQQQELRNEVLNVSTDLIRVNAHNLKGLNQKQTNDLIKKLLFEKLCTKEKQVKPEKETKKKSKKDKKKKYKVASSSDDTSEDDSSDE